MGVKVFQINTARVFSAGDWVNGQVILELDKPIKSRGVLLKCVGAAKVHWSVQNGAGPGGVQYSHYKNHQTYFNQQAVLWGTGRDLAQHPAGQVVYPFQFQLPQNLPSSFEGKHGNVRYYMECVVDKLSKFDYKAKTAFTVNAVYDLNQQRLSRRPTQVQQMKTLCCLCCTSGPITNKLSLERRGYVPGEYIIVNGEVDNKSSRTMSSSSLVLRKVTTFIATRNRIHSAQTIVHLKRGEIPPGDTEVWSGQPLQIPPLPPSDLIHCKIIDIKYYVVLIAAPSGPGSDLEAAVEVIIGTVPLRNIQHMYSNSFAPALQYNMIAGEPGAGAASAPGNLYNQPSAPLSQLSMEAPPPTYAISVLGQVNIRDASDQYTHGNLDYAPQYTYYTWNK